MPLEELSQAVRAQLGTFLSFLTSPAFSIAFLMVLQRVSIDP